MSKVIYVDRSRIEVHQRCQRLRWLQYHEAGTGIDSAARPLPLAVGSAVHKGLEVLLRDGQRLYYASSANWNDPVWKGVESLAVDAAISELAQHRGKLALDTQEAAAQQSAVAVPEDVMRQQLAESLGISVEDAGLDALMTTQAPGKQAFDDYLWKEQSGLVEGMVRAYARRRLRPLLEEFEVLEVEREGTWLLAQWPSIAIPPNDADAHAQIIFCSRPDALLRSRADNSLYLMSFKTAATWDRRKELDAQHDMQGLSEGVEVERRLGEWWQAIKDGNQYNNSYNFGTELVSSAIIDYLRSLPSPPRILGIRYEYMLKGYRGEDKELSAKFGFRVWSQRSHLVRRYRAVSLPKKGEGGFNLGDYCWSFDYLREDGTESKLYYGHWKSEPVFDDGARARREMAQPLEAGDSGFESHFNPPSSMRRWIDLLDDTQEAMSAYDSTVGMEPRALGWRSAGQALGFTAQHPLDAIFVPPITVYRNDDDLRDWLEQTEAQEQRVAEAVERVESASSEDERRSLLNQHFIQSRRACSYPSECVMVKICYGGEDIRHDPLASEKFIHRTPNHEPERRAMEAIELPLPEGGEDS